MVSLTMASFLTAFALTASMATPFLLGEPDTPQCTLGDVYAQGSRDPASLPVDNSTRSYWLFSEPDANPLAKVGSEGNLTMDTDVCIIGSGMTGISTAYHLSRSDPTLSITILEARDFCSGATGRNGGHLTPLVGRQFRMYEKLYGTEQALKGYELESRTAKELVKLILDHNLTDAVTLVEGGHTMLLLTEEEEAAAHADYDAALAAGLEMNATWHSKDEMKEHYGTPFPAFRTTGYNFYPLKVVTELFRLASAESNVMLHTRTPVHSIKPSANAARSWDLATDRGGISCSYVVHATNAYASHLLPHLSGPSGIIPTRGQVMALRANTSLAKIGNASWDSNFGNEYWVPRPASASEHPIIIVGGGREAATPTFELYVTDDSSLNERTTETLKGYLPQVFPGKFEQGREPEMSWSGIMGFTETADPFVGPVLVSRNVSSSSHKGQFIAAGYTGHGMPRVFSCAEVVASMISAEIKKAKWTTPSWLPDRYLTWTRSGPK